MIPTDTHESDSILLLYSMDDTITRASMNENIQDTMNMLIRLTLSDVVILDGRRPKMV